MTSTIATAYVQLMPSFRDGAKEITKQLSGGDMAKAMNQAGEESGNKFVSGLGTAVKAIGAVALAAATAASAAALKIGKSVVGSFAEYEQLVGGVETLFKGASETVQRNADQAFKTAGLSANQYMSTVTSFSASLISSLGGDTAKAAKYADMAIVDMADNANKMGTNIGSIQDAYQGFAKQNYTMLDNLKLGYGGTKTEMQRLLKDAEKLPGAMGRKFDLNNYADVVEAIHLVQTEWGITGTTMKEAEATISGSFGMLKGAWANLVTGMGRADGDIKTLVGNVVSSFTSLTNNIKPVIQNLISSLPTVMAGFGTALAGLLPTLTSAARGLFDSLLATIISMLPQLSKIAVDAVILLSASLLAQLPGLVSAGGQVLLALVQGITAALPHLIPLAITALQSLITGLISSAPLLVGAARDLVAAFGQGLKAAFPGAVGDSLGTLFSTISGLVEPLAKAFGTVATTAGGALSGALTTLLPILANVASTLLRLVTPLLENEKLVKALMVAWAGKQAISGAQSALNGLGGTLGNLAAKIAGLGTSGGGALGNFKGGLDAVKGAVTGLKDAGSGVAGFFNHFRDGFRDAGAAASSFSGVADTLGGTVKTIGTTIGSGFTTALNAAKTAITAVGGAYKALSATMLANPIMLVVAAIAALVAGLVYFFTQTETGRAVWASFTAWLTETWARVKEIALAVWEAISGAVRTAIETVSNVVHAVVDALVTYWSNMWETIKAVLAGVLLTIVALLTGDTAKIKEIWSAVGAKLREIWSETWEKVKAVFSAAKDAIVSKFNEILNFIGTWLSNTKTAIVTKFNEILESIKTWLANTKTAIETKFSEIVEWVKGIPAKFKAGLETLTQLPEWFRGWISQAKTAVSNKFDEIVEFVRGIPNKIKTALGNLGSLLTDAGHNLIEGLKSGIAAAAASLAETVLAPIRNAVNAAKSFLKIKSPSRLMMEIGSYTAEGLQLGLESGADDIVAAATDIASGIVGAINPDLEVLAGMPINPKFAPVVDTTWAANLATVGQASATAPVEVKRAGHQLTFNTLAVSPRDVVRGLDLADMKARFA